MIINLIDGDMITYFQTPFNIDLMKISTYYKQQRHIVNMTPFIDLEKYSKVFYYKDYYDGVFDSELLMNNKVEYGGKAFNKNVYKPLPLEIDNCLCDRYIYNSMQQLFCTSKTNQTLFDQMMRAQHLRISKDGKNIDNEWEKQIDNNYRTRTFIFHDYDLGKIDHSIDLIKDIYNTIPGKQTKYIGMKFPVQIYNGPQLLEWTQFHPMALFFNLEYNGIMEDELLKEFCERQSGTSMAAQSFYNVTYGMTEEEFLSKLVQLYRQIVFLRTNRIKIRLKYDDTIFSNKKWCRLLDLFIHYYNQALEWDLKTFNRVAPFDSLYSFVASFVDIDTYKFHFTQIENQNLLKDEARELFKFVQTENYELFKDFYECHQVQLKGGNFCYD